MAKFMSSHTLPPGTMKREQVNQLAEAAKNDPVIKPLTWYGHSKTWGRRPWCYPR